MDHEEANLVDSDLRKLMDGMRNNHPQLLPRTNLTDEEIDKALSKIGDEFVHLSLEPPPVVAIPREVSQHLARFARKLTCALYFKESGKIIPLSAGLWTNWVHHHDKRMPSVVDAFDKALPTFRTGTRSNRSLTSQFKYACGVGEMGMLFGFLAQFGKSIAVAGAVHDGTLEDLRLERWKTLSQLLAEEAAMGVSK